MGYTSSVGARRRSYGGTALAPAPAARPDGSLTELVIVLIHEYYANQDRRLTKINRQENRRDRCKPRDQRITIRRG